MRGVRGQRQFGTFPKIHQFWYPNPSVRFFCKLKYGHCNWWAIGVHLGALWFPAHFWLWPACLPANCDGCSKKLHLGRTFADHSSRFKQFECFCQMQRKGHTAFLAWLLSQKNHICVDNKAALICSAYSREIVEIQHQNSFLSADHWPILYLG